ELQGLGGRPKGLPMAGELDRSRTARRQVCILQGLRKPASAGGTERRQHREGVRRLSEETRRGGAARHPSDLPRAHRAWTAGDSSRLRANARYSVYVLLALAARRHVERLAEARCRDRG